MLSTFLILAFGAGAILLQTTLLHLAPIGPAIPDLILVICVYLGLRHQSAGGAVGAFFLGYMLDTFSGTDVGINAFAMTLVFLTVYLLSRRLWIEGGLSNSVTVFAAAVLKTLTIGGLVAVSTGALTAEGMRDDLLGGALAAVVSPFVFGALGRAKGWFGVTQQ
jgi:rod shape-determining protein MreD